MFDRWGQGTVRVLADGRVWLHVRDMGGHHVCSFWSRDADRRLVLNKSVFDHYG